jgi:hypothetical protein
MRQKTISGFGSILENTKNNHAQQVNPRRIGKSRTGEQAGGIKVAGERGKISFSE